MSNIVLIDNLNDLRYAVRKAVSEDYKSNHYSYRQLSDKLQVSTMILSSLLKGDCNQDIKKFNRSSQCNLKFETCEKLANHYKIPFVISNGIMNLNLAQQTN